jgi:hypothetical protein
MPKKEVDEDKAFEQALKGKMGWKCSCAWKLLIKRHLYMTLLVKNVVRLSRLPETQTFASVAKEANNPHLQTVILKKSHKDKKMENM